MNQNKHPSGIGENMSTSLLWMKFLCKIIATNNCIKSSLLKFFNFITTVMLSLMINIITKKCMHNHEPLTSRISCSSTYLRPKTSKSMPSRQSHSILKWCPLVRSKQKKLKITQSSELHFGKEKVWSPEAWKSMHYWQSMIILKIPSSKRRIKASWNMQFDEGKSS